MRFRSIKWILVLSLLVFVSCKEDELPPDNSQLAPTCNGAVGGACAPACDPSRGETCSNSQPKGCGNGVLEEDEFCDDGNTDSGDGCNNFCAYEAKLASSKECGNAILEEDEGEKCDDGNTDDNDGCSSSCQLETPICGNGILEGNEICDDGNTVDDDNCSNGCLIPGCGNGVVDGQEFCDGGPNCNEFCAYTMPPGFQMDSNCGNGTKEDPEQCDDGNTADGDGCSSQCAVELKLEKTSVEVDG